MLTASGNKAAKNTFRFDVNPDHTHFIIYDDLPNNNQTEIGGFSSLTSINVVGTNDQLSYDQFRDKIESLFTRSLAYYKRKLKLGIYY